MGRTFAYVVGSLLFLRGMMLAVQPRLLPRLWEGGLRRYAPKIADDLFRDFFRMADTTIRVLGFWFMAIAALVLWLASRMARD